MTIDTELRRIFELQGQALPRLRATTADERIARLQRLQSAIQAHFNEAVAALNKDLGKPPFEAVFEVGAVFAEIDHVCAHLAEWMTPAEVTPGPHATPGARARIIHQPRGRVLIFSPWNFPFNLLFQPLVGAIAAGNAAVLKPSELAPATAEVAAKIVAEAFDESDVALFQGGRETAEALLERPFDHIFFTGSTEVGRRVMAAAARHLSTMTLELGGKCPVVIDKTADIGKAADRIAWGKFLNAGQICLAPDHVWVHADQRDDFAAAVLERVKQSYYAEGAFNRQDSAHIINDGNLQRIAGLVRESVDAGATRLTGAAADDLYMEPVVLVDVQPDSAIMREEIFGPVLPILTYNDTDTLIDLMSRRDKPLALYVFSEDPAFIEQLIARTSSGGVTVNDILQHASDPALPFGGVGASGMGAYHGEHGFRELSHTRSIYYQAAENPAEAFFRPPYGSRMPM